MNEEDDAGRYGRTCLAKSNSHARTGAGETNSFSAELATSRIGNLARLIYVLLEVVTIDTYTCRVNTTPGTCPRVQE